MLALAVAAPVSRADIAGAGPDESVAQAFGPLQPGVTYSGAFRTQDDVDYLAVVVSKAGETLEFTLSNTTRPCVDPDDQGCPVYATLMTPSDQQVGGDSSAAGTIATNNDTEVFDWTFQSPGTYYVLMESNGDLAAGSPTYTLGFNHVLSGSAPIISSLRVPAHQHGASVKAKLVLAQAAVTLRADLLLLRKGNTPHRIVRQTRHNLAPGSYHLLMKLPKRYRQMLAATHSLSLLLKITVVGASGSQQTITRHVTITR